MERLLQALNEVIASGLLDPTVMGTATEALDYKIPGGMLSNLISQLKAQNAIDRLPEVLEETLRVGRTSAILRCNPDGHSRCTGCDKLCSG